MKTDLNVYAEPPLPPLPVAGGKFTDPVFGTEIMRATDQRDDPVGCGTFYSHWPSFNANSTKLLIGKGGRGALLKDFDPVSFTLGATRPLPTFADGTSVGWQGAIWHNTDPNIIFVYPGWQSAAYPNSGRKLYALDIRTGVPTLIKDFGGDADIFSQAYTSNDHDVFVGLHSKIVNGSANVIGYTVYKRSTNFVLDAPNPFVSAIDEVHIDRSGRWVEVRAESVLDGQPHTQILDLATNAITTLIKNSTERPGGHGDSGFGSMVGADNWNSGLQRRSYLDPHNPVDVFPFPVPFSFHSHLSMNAVDQSWATVGSYTSEGMNRAVPLANEIFQAALDGSKQVKRICHTRSVTSDPNGADYWATPRANISKDGRFIAFTSNWGNSGRYDLFIAKVDGVTTSTPAPQPQPTATPMPTPIPEYRDETFPRDNDANRNALYQRMFGLGYAVWSELQGNSLRFRKF